MDSVLLSTIFLSISLALIIILPATINAVAIDDDALMFVDYFKSKENGFMLIFAISMLKEDARKTICGKFKKSAHADPSGQIHILKLELNNPADGNMIELSPIPAFKCMPKDKGKSFFITYLISEKVYMELEQTDGESLSSGGRELDVGDSKIISQYSSIHESMEKQIVEYFRSEYYRKIAHSVLLEFLNSGYWVNLCNKFSLHNVAADENQIIESLTAIFHSALLFKIPLLPCLNPDTNGNQFYIAYYTHNIYFKVLNDINLEAKSATYDVFQEG